MCRSTELEFIFQKANSRKLNNAFVRKLRSPELKPYIDQLSLIYGSDTFLMYEYG